MKVRVKVTSKRSGKVGWLDKGGVPRDHKSEAHAFPGLAEAIAAWTEYETTLTKVVGRCAWTPTYEDA